MTTDERPGSRTAGFRTFTISAPDGLQSLKVGDKVMSESDLLGSSGSPITIARTALAAEAIRIMEERKITSLPVVNGSNEVEGVVHLHDLWPTDMI